MADLDLVDFAVDYARQKGASYAEARYEHQTNEDFILKNSVLDALYFGEDAGIGVRVLANGGIGVGAAKSAGRAGGKAPGGETLKDLQGAPPEGRRASPPPTGAVAHRR